MPRLARIDAPGLLHHIIVKRVAEIYGMEKGEFLSKGRQQRRVKARSLLCFWAVREIGMSLRELAGRLEMSAPGVGFAVERGHDPTDLVSAIQKSKEWGNRIPIGVFYRNPEKLSFEKQSPALKDGPLTERRLEPARVDKVIDSFL